MSYDLYIFKPIPKLKEEEIKIVMSLNIFDSIFDPKYDFDKIKNIMESELGEDSMEEACGDTFLQISLSNETDNQEIVNLFVQAAKSNSLFVYDPQKENLYSPLGQSGSLPWSKNNLIELHALLENCDLVGADKYIQNYNLSKGSPFSRTNEKVMKSLSAQIESDSSTQSLLKEMCESGNHSRLFLALYCISSCKNPKIEIMGAAIRGLIKKGAKSTAWVYAKELKNIINVLWKNPCIELYSIFAQDQKDVVTDYKNPFFNFLTTEILKVLSKKYTHQESFALILGYERNCNTQNHVSDFFKILTLSHVLLKSKQEVLNIGYIYQVPGMLYLTEIFKENKLSLFDDFIYTEMFFLQNLFYNMGSSIQNLKRNLWEDDSKEKLLNGYKILELSGFDNIQAPPPPTLWERWNESSYAFRYISLIKGGKSVEEAIAEINF